MSNVISLTNFKNKKEDKQNSETNSEKYTETRTQPKEESEFEAIMRKNEENKEKMRKERLEANKGVLRSYKIKR